MRMLIDGHTAVEIHTALLTEVINQSTWFHRNPVLTLLSDDHKQVS